MPRPKTVKVFLSDVDRAWLEKVVRSGSHPVRMVTRARVLLELDETDRRAPDRAEVARLCATSVTTVLNVARLFVDTADPMTTVTRKKRETAPVPSLVTGDVEARLIALACSSPPPGRARWSVRLLADKIVELDDIPDLSYSTISRVLKKRNFVLI